MYRGTRKKSVFQVHDLRYIGELGCRMHESVRKWLFVILTGALHAIDVNAPDDQGIVSFLAIRVNIPVSVEGFRYAIAIFRRVASL